MQKQLQRFGTAITAASAASLVAFQRMGKGGAELEALEQKFANVMHAFGQDANGLLMQWDEVARGAVSRAELMRKANYLALTGVPVSEMTWMLKAVGNASAATGQDFEQLFEKLAMAWRDPASRCWTISASSWT